MPSTSGHSAQSPQRGWSFQPATGAQVSPPSSVRNSPCGEPPAYQEPGSSAWPGVSQNTELRDRPWASPSAKAGGGVASCHVRPRSLERNTVGPRWPGAAGRQEGGAVARVEHDVLDDVAEEHRPGRRPGRARPPSLARIQAPLRVPTRSLGPSRSAGIASPAGSHSGRPNAAVESIVVGHGRSVGQPAGSGPANGRQRVALDRADRRSGLGDDHRALPHDQRG